MDSDQGLGKFADNNFPFLIGQPEALNVDLLQADFSGLKSFSATAFETIRSRYSEEAEADTQVLYPQRNRTVVIIGPEGLLGSSAGPVYYQLPNPIEAWRFCHDLALSTLNLEQAFRSEPWYEVAGQIIGLSLQAEISPFSIIQSAANLYTSRISTYYQESAEELSWEIQLIEHSNNRIFAVDQGKDRTRLTEAIKTTSSVNEIISELQLISTDIQESKLLTLADKEWIHHAFTGKSTHAEDDDSDLIAWSIPTRLELTRSLRRLDPTGENSVLNRKTNTELERVHEVLRAAVIRLSEVLGVEATEAFQILRARQPQPQMEVAA